MRTILAQRMKRRAGQLEEFLKLIDELDGVVPDIRRKPISDNVNWTEEDAKTEFGWRTVNPEEYMLENNCMDQESVRSEKFRTKNWNGQILS
jgi:hypothetical protein